MNNVSKSKSHTFGYSKATRQHGNTATRQHGKLIVLMCGLTLLLFTGCQKDKALPADNSIGNIGNAQKITFTETANAIYHYQLDNVPVDEGTFAVEEGSPLHFLITDAQPQNGKGVFTIHAFTTEEGLLQYGDDQNIPLRRNQSLEEHLRTVATNNGWIAHEETTGEVPQAFKDYTQHYLDQKSIVPSAITIFNNNCTGNGTGIGTMLINGFIPALCCGFNDNVERFLNGPVSPAVWNKVYTRKWWNTPIFQGWSLFGVSICFEGPLAGLANRASSWITI